MTDGSPYAVQVPRGYRVGSWTVREPLATGGFGSVYAARREGPTEDGSPTNAALKFLPTGLRTPRQLSHLRELAEREVELLRRLSSPRLIRLYETLTVDDPDTPALDGATVLVLEEAEGSLAQLLALPEPAGPALLAQICEGLHQLHHAGWVHGDLKPGNVLLMADGSARLADFNMAAEMEGTHAYSPAFSTPDYTPPELLWSEIGERGQRIRPTADVWAFGVLAHQVLTRTFPLPGGTPAARRDAAVRYARGEDELRLSPELPEEWREIVTDCLARTHEERAARSGTDSADLLRRVEAAAGTEPSPKLPRLRPRRIHPAVLSACAVAALLTVSTSMYVIRDDGDDKPADPARYGAAELRTDKGIPVAYRKLIVDSAHGCDEKDLTPAVIAAILKVESDFDPDLSEPGSRGEGEYGIARWTPRVLWYWLPSGQRPAKIKDLKPPFPPKMSIPAVGRYTCDIARQLYGPDRLKGSRGEFIATGYHSSVTVVNEEGGVPARFRGYADKIGHYLKEYTPPAS
ncbi:protein kinase [Streptomyces sp. NPDC059009]|uniref:protein kinase domain-containing protein n=1 Tax=Streptomyces sp. NPDC059009 TaxID=3346694 RepID=UPI0036CCC410